MGVLLKNAWRVVLFAIALFLLSGCASQKIPAGTPTGYVACSVGRYFKDPNRTGTVYYRSLDGKYFGEFTYNHQEWSIIPWPRVGAEMYFDDEKISGRAFFRELPIGYYEIYSVMFKVGTPGVIEYMYYPNHEFSILFEVTENTTTYLGAFTSYGPNGDNPYRIVRPGPSYFVVTDEVQRDLKIVVEQYSRIGFTILDNRTLNSTATPLIRPPFKTPE